MHEHCCHYRHCCHVGRHPEWDGELSEEQPLTVTVGRSTAGQVVVRAVGEIDLLSAPEWELALRTAVALVAPGGGAGAPAEVRCDLDGIGFLGAAGVSVLVAVDELARTAGVVLVVVATIGPAGRVLELTGVARELHRARALGEPRTITPTPVEGTTRARPTGRDARP